jgi:hypothetical protein
LGACMGHKLRACSDHMPSSSLVGLRCSMCLRLSQNRWNE